MGSLRCAAYAFLSGIFLLCLTPSAAKAACGDPAGEGGHIIYNQDYDVLQYCDSEQWIAFPKAVGPLGNCTEAGSMLYNEDENVLQWCDGTYWHAAGIRPGAGGSGCSTPSGVAGDIIFNADYKMLQYCDGSYWRMIGKAELPDPCDDNPAPGTMCNDGSVYVNLHGGQPLFTTACDKEQTWDGAACTGTRLGASWNNGSALGTVDTPIANCASTGACTADGAANTDILIATDSDGLSGGFQPHQAAAYCRSLGPQWYLPSWPELDTLYNNRDQGVLAGTFTMTPQAASAYWSSSETSANGAWYLRFQDNFSNGSNKFNQFAVRCVRR